MSSELHKHAQTWILRKMQLLLNYSMNMEILQMKSRRFLKFSLYKMYIHISKTSPSPSHVFQQIRLVFAILVEWNPRILLVPNYFQITRRFWKFSLYIRIRKTILEEGRQGTLILCQIILKSGKYFCTRRYFQYKIRSIVNPNPTQVCFDADNFWNHCDKRRNFS